MKQEKKTIEEINELHFSLESMVKLSTSTALEIGRQLSELKKATPDINLVHWVEANCAFSKWTARLYLTMYENQKEIEEVDRAHEGFRMLKNNPIGKPTEKEVKATRRTEFAIHRMIVACIQAMLRKE